MQELLDDGANSFVWSLTHKQIRARFARPLYRDIIEDAAFQRLKQVSFLGAIDYLIPYRRSLRRKVNSRFQHTLGVATLALRYADLAQLSEHDEKLIVVAALLHDIGHGPLSHSLEPVFDHEFSLNHHRAGLEVIRGESPLGKAILRVLQSNYLDPEEVISLIAGKHRGNFVHLFASPMNIDTLDGILRCIRYMDNVIALTPEKLLDGLLFFDSGSQTRFDTFWQTKQFVYHFLINGRMGVFADALARKYMLNNLKSFSRHDFFLGEQQLFRIHKSFARLLGSAKHLFKSSPQREIAFKRRCFYLDRSHPLKS